MSAMVSWILAFLVVAAGAGIMLAIVYLLATIIASAATREDGPRGKLPER